jgi:hypothetical protein
LQGITVERVGEVMEHGASEVLVRAAGLGPGTRVMITHLPNAVDGLKVQEVPERKTAAAQPPIGSATAERAEHMP